MLRELNAAQATETVEKQTLMTPETLCQNNLQKEKHNTPADPDLSVFKHTRYALIKHPPAVSPKG